MMGTFKDTITQFKTNINKKNSLFYLLFRDNYFRAGLIILFFFIILGIIGFVYLPYNPISTTGPILSPPTSNHWFGTTDSGQDVFSQWMYGVQPTLFVAALSGLIAVALGLSVGLLAGFYRLADEPLMRTADVFLILPVLPLLIVISSFVRPTNFTASVIIAIFSWPWMARVIRSNTLSLKNSAYVEVGLMSGVPRRKILLGDILKHILPLATTYAIISAANAIVFLAFLDYLGVGPITSFSWGTMLFYAQISNAIFVNAWWWIIPPGISIGILAMSLSFIAYSIETNYRSVYK